MCSTRCYVANYEGMWCIHLRGNQLPFVVIHGSGGECYCDIDVRGDIPGQGIVDNYLLSWVLCEI